MNIAVYIVVFLLLINYFISINLNYTLHDKENAFYLACLACICTFADRLKPIIEYIKNFKFNQRNK